MILPETDLLAAWLAEDCPEVRSARITADNEVTVQHWSGKRLAYIIEQLPAAKPFSSEDV